jgi:FKBP-type peptidyl-prolyl cis-trans isomerase SlyD
MSESKLTVQANTVVTLDYTLTVDGEVVDQSQESGPIEFLQGSGQVIPGLENALYGMASGESREITVQPADGYGEEDVDAYAEIPRSEFPAEIPLEIGVQLQLRDEDGDEFEAYVEEVQDKVVILNFNHPLAGKELNFAVTVVDIRPATAEEIDHGHAHGHHHHDEEE